MDDERDLFRALHLIASHVNASSDVEDTVGRVLQAFCRESRWASAVVMRVDAAEGVVRVVARHDPGGIGAGPEHLWPLSESPTRLVVASSEPLVLPDAQVAADFPGYRREAQARGYRTVVLLPLALDGDPPQAVLAACSRDLVSVSDREIAFLQLVVHLGAIAIEKARALHREQGFAQRLTGVLARNAALLDRVLADGSAPALAALVADTLPNPLVVVDLTARRLSCARSPCPEALDDAAWGEAVSGEGRAQFLALARQSATGAAIQTRTITLRLADRVLRCEAAICPLRVEGALVGALLVFSPPAEAAGLDHLLIDSARFGLSVQMMRAHVRFTTEARSLEVLFSGLLLGTMRRDEIEERAARLDVALEGPACLIVLTGFEDAATDGAAGFETLRAVTALVRRFDRRAAAMLKDGAVVVHCPWTLRDEPRWRRLADQVLSEVQLATDRPALLTRSRPCSGLGDYPAAYRECQRVLELARRFDRVGEVAAQDFGPFPVLMSAVDTGEMRDFVEGLIGAVARHDAARGTAYLATLSAYLDHGGRTRACAAALGLHVTTLRYRLARLSDLFGLAFETPDQRFSLQLALRFQDVLTKASPAVPARGRRSGTGASSAAADGSSAHGAA